MINNYSNGGLKMIDFQSFNKVSKNTWIKKYLDIANQEKWKLFFDLELEKYGYSLPFTSNPNKKDTLKIFKASDSVIREILVI